MTRRYVQADLTLEQAQQVCAQVVEQRIRWGIQYDGGEVGIDRIMDAIVVIGKAGNAADADLREKLTLAHRQLAAAKARETKLLKRLGVGREDADPEATDAPPKKYSMEDYVQDELEAQGGTL